VFSSYFFSLLLPCPTFTDKKIGCKTILLLNNTINMVELTLKRIRLKRIEKAYSQEYIASKLNISQSYYAKIENSKAELSLSQLFLILSLLEIDYAVFFKYIKRHEEKINQNKSK